MHARSLARIAKPAFERPFLLAAGLAIGFGAMLAAATPEPPQPAPFRPSIDGAPATLHETGLYAGPGTLEIDPAHLSFSPQYPLWTDGAVKRRWFSLPPGAEIDASDPDAWEFPVGARFWKEFAFDGRKVETRYIERLPNGEWLFAAYGWSDDGRSATLVSPKGRMNAHPLGAGRQHRIPGVDDCRACHLAAPSPVLGFSALQLSGARDSAFPSAAPAPADGTATAAHLESLQARGVIRGLDPADLAPRIPASSALERAALGYLHGNCGHCHNDAGPLAGIGLTLRQPVTGGRLPAIETAFDQPLRSPPSGLAPGTALRIAPGRPELSALAQRLASRQRALQMPPFGTELVDAEAVDLITRWIAEAGMVPTRSQHAASRD